MDILRNKSDFYLTSIQITRGLDFKILWVEGNDEGNGDKKPFWKQFFGLQYISILKAMAQSTNKSDILEEKKPE